ncbi:flavoprotein [Bacillus pinisoli]|uniref:flavoprotein n=1 Tax=Bacillus pinisoli TaxID=2901866 RepID=UPI001FF2C5EF|nr:flavoprotein [Bacillus pinisoli]
MSKPKNILLGLTGAISVSNIFPYISTIQSYFGCRMHIMMTDAAQKFIPASTLIHSIDGHVFVDLSEKGPFKMPHVELTHWADAIVILPASANTLAKTAQGFSQDIVSATILASNCPVIFFPSMYIGMWQKKSVQRNIELLREDEYLIYNGQLGQEQSNVGGALPTPVEACRFINKAVFV